ncbi:MAG TPA: NADH-quinone oxidoreductase subunit H [Anaerovoracaceae bacterium]|nr:NADH-quinone oxidoreductase subunit H [Anaerovoracaceae bacterium]
MNYIIYTTIQILMMLLLAPLMNGIIKKVKAYSQKRTGPPFLQMYYDLFKLIKKNSVVSESTSWIFKATPYVVFSTTLVAALLVPVTVIASPEIVIPGDFILLVSTFALGRFFMMAAGLDAGSTFGGMGSSREAMISSLAEPSILVCLFTAGLISGSTSMTQMMSYMQNLGSPLIHPAFMLLSFAMITIIMMETARIPVDDPSTHLELTMVHEAMILEYSGRHLALMEYAAAIKQLIFTTLLVNLLLPHDQLISSVGLAGLLVSLFFYFVKVAIVTVIIGLVEINTVKLRLFSIPNLAALSFILSFLAFIQHFLLGGGYA